MILVTHTFIALFEKTYCWTVKTLARRHTNKPFSCPHLKARDCVHSDRAGPPCGRGRDGGHGRGRGHDGGRGCGQGRGRGRDGGRGHGRNQVRGRGVGARG